MFSGFWANLSTLLYLKEKPRSYSNDPSFRTDSHVLPVKSLSPIFLKIYGIRDI